MNLEGYNTSPNLHFLFFIFSNLIVRIGEGI